jgi:uncharacterized peroxidase-related enzyme
VEAHADDLRAEVNDEAFVRQLEKDWRTAPLTSADAALCAYAEKLTRTPWTATRDDLDTLRREGFDDEQISDAVQIIGYFNYINRVADGLGVDLEESMKA